MLQCVCFFFLGFKKEQKEVSSFESKGLYEQNNLTAWHCFPKQTQDFGKPLVTCESNFRGL